MPRSTSRLRAIVRKNESTYNAVLATTTTMVYSFISGSTWVETAIAVVASSVISYILDNFLFALLPDFF